MWQEDRMNRCLNKGISMIHNFIKKMNNLIVTLRFSILFIFISLFIATTLLIAVITSLRYASTLSYAAIELMNYTSTSVLRELTANIRPVATEAEFTAHLLDKGVLNDDESQLVPYTFYLTKTLPLVVSAYWGDKHGDFIYSKKERDGSISTEIYKRRTLPATRTILYRDKDGNLINKVPSLDLSYDPRVRPWYLKVKEEKKTIWTDIYFFQPIPDIGITTASPVFRKGQFYGAFGIDIDLGYLSEFVEAQKITPNGYAFIITKEGKLVAYPKRKPFIDVSVEKGQFINVNTVPMSLIKNTLDKYNKSGQKELIFAFDYKGESYLVAYESVPDLAAYGWLIGVIVPESDFTYDLQKMNLSTLGASLVILILGIILVSGLITRIVRPIKSLVKETENIKHFDLEGEIQVNSRIKEVIYLRDAIHSMKIGLKLFQKYIPKILVRQLIESGEDIRVGGVRKQLAVFFSDIENFTTIAEKTEPNLLLKQMSDYFEELSQIIISEKGTIDKYIGDAIMAFWGAPLPNDEPCYHAAYAALRCQSKLDELNKKWEKQGKTRLVTRIGIHTGDAIVGNLGSSERLNYTAIGDTINTASRFESINKNYNTKIIVSDAVYELIKDRFILRMIDCVVVKGRTKSSCIYELLSNDITKVPFDITAYRPIFEKGFRFYQQQQWDEAISHFEDCLKIYPNDTIAPIFVERCKYFKLHPPRDDWNGIWTALYK